MEIYKITGHEITWQSPGVIPGARTTSLPHIPMTLAEACPVPKNIPILKESLNKIYNRIAEIESDAEHAYKALAFWDKESGGQSLAMNKLGLLLNKIKQAKQALDPYSDEEIQVRKNNFEKTD